MRGASAGLCRLLAGQAFTAPVSLICDKPADSIACASMQLGIGAHRGLTSN
jgi:hypothetical protein